jgi:nucleoid DNA-binding protein
MAKDVKTSAGMTGQKTSKTAFLNQVARASGVDISTVTRVYTAMINEIQSIVCDGTSLSLTGFGTFYLQKHKGHPVQFEGKSTRVPDYWVFKFSASDVLNTRIRQLYAEKHPGEQGLV